MSLLAPLWKGLCIAAHLLTGACLAAVVAVSRGVGRRVGWLDAVVIWWYRRLLHCLGVCVRVDGDLGGAALLAANHVSWLDIPVIGSQGNVRFLSKAEVRRWPLIGWMAHLAGTVFIHRGAHRAGEAIAGIQAHIQAGRPVAVFPEGTTSDGLEVLRFHPRLFAVCQPGGPAVQPVALRYGSGPEPDLVAPFLGDEDLLTHLWRLLLRPGIDVRVSFLAPIPAAGLDRRRLAEQTRQAIAAQLLRDGVGAGAGSHLSSTADQICPGPVAVQAGDAG